MSVCENKTKNGRLTFSDQITSRLQRWVQRTTIKGREREKAKGDVSIKKLQRESNHVKENDLNVRQSPPRDKIPGHSDTRTILELEKALQDLISNCVTNASAAASSPAGSCTSAQLTMTTKDIESENGDTNGVGTRRGEMCGDGDIGHRTRKSRHGRNVNGMVQASGLDETQGNYASCEVIIPGASASTDERVAVGQKSSAFSTRDHVKDAQVKDHHLGKNASTNNERNSSYQTEQENTKAGEDRNHPSSSGVTEADASPGNANNGLSGGSSIKTQFRRISRTGRNGTLSRRSKTLDGQEIDAKNWTPMAAKQRPPLRRIQSEGDSISKRFSFKDSDVSEFAETCIRHAQRKRLSQAISIDSDADSLSEMLFGETVGPRGQQQLSRRSEFAVSRRLALRFPAWDSGNVSDYEPGSPDVTASRPSDDHDALRTAQHPPLSDRRSFLGDVDRGLQASRLSPQCGISRKHRSGTRDSGNVSDFEPGSPDITASRPSDQHALHTVQHAPLSAQPSSLSLPLEKNMAKDVNQQSFFKPKTKSKTPSEGSCSPQSPKRSAISPKFKKFPYQPVFYVPQTGDSSNPPPIPPKMNRSRSLTESKPVNVEHLI